jgi:hypothetical protein
MVRGKWEQAFADERWERKQRVGKTETQIWYDGYGSPRIVEMHYDLDGIQHIDSIYDPTRLVPLERGYCTIPALLGILAGAAVCCSVLLNDGKDAQRSKTQDAQAQFVSKKVSTQMPDRIPPKNNAYEEPRWNWKRSRGTEQKLMQGAHRSQERIWAGRRH